MQYYKILDSDIKGFMAKLLAKDTFDFFLVRSVSVISFAEFSINSILSKEEDNLFWEKVRPFVYDIIKGKDMPKEIKIIFSIKNETLLELSQNLASAFLNLHYENKDGLQEIILTTGSSQKTFAIGKKEEIAFVEYIENFFKNADISVVTE